MIFEHIRKVKVYFKQWDSYWQLNPTNEDLILDPGKTGRYPLDFKPRIIEGHYPHFDENGVPMWPRPDGNGHFYHYTTMFSFALGQSDYYLLTGDSKYLKSVLAVADYVLKTHIEQDDGALLKEINDNNEHTGNVSAMTQGEAMSVLCRASEYSGNEVYASIAEKLILPFEKDVNEGGVLGKISSLNLLWYEEYVNQPLNHVLNGMVYSLWGLRDLHALTGNEIAQKLYLSGVKYIETALPHFDSGFWTYYWIAEKGSNYVSSMMYHNLHICQLKALYNQTGIETFREYADKFIKYSQSPLNRLKAAKEISVAKISR